MLFGNSAGSFRFPLYQVDGGGSGGGNTGGAAGGGAQGASGAGGSGEQQLSQGGGQNTGGGASNTPTVHDYDENMLVRFKGSDKPVKLGDHVRGFQSQFTKASQEAAKLKRDFAATQAELQRIREAAGGRNGDPNSGGNAGADMLASIEQQPFIDGKTMGSVLKDLQGGIRERDMVQLAVVKKIEAIEKILNDLHGTSINQSHEAKLKRWLGEGGYDPQDQNTYELADIIYRGYEGENLDEEFPAIFESRWKQMQAAVQRRAERERQRTRNLPFTPGKGGNGAPGKAQGLTGRETPKELSDIFFSRFGGGSDT